MFFLFSFLFFPPLLFFLTSCSLLFFLLYCLCLVSSDYFRANFIPFFFCFYLRASVRERFFHTATSIGPGFVSSLPTITNKEVSMALIVFLHLLPLFLLLFLLLAYLLAYICCRIMSQLRPYTSSSFLLTCTFLSFQLITCYASDVLLVYGVWRMETSGGIQSIHLSSRINCGLDEDIVSYLLLLSTCMDELLAATNYRCSCGGFLLPSCSCSIPMCIVFNLV